MDRINSDYSIIPQIKMIKGNQTDFVGSLFINKWDRTINFFRLRQWKYNEYRIFARFLVFRIRCVSVGSYLSSSAVSMCA